MSRWSSSAPMTKGTARVFWSGTSGATICVASCSSSIYWLDWLVKSHKIAYEIWTSHVYDLELTKIWKPRVHVGNWHLSSKASASSIPSLRGSLGRHRWFCNQFSPFFPVPHCPLGLTNSGLSISWCCLLTSSSVCLVFFPLSQCLARWFWPDLINGKHDHTTAVCVSFRSSGLRVVQLPAGSRHGLPYW